MQPSDFEKFKTIMAARTPESVKSDMASTNDRWQERRSAYLDVSTGQVHPIVSNSRVSLADISSEGWQLAAASAGEPVLDGRVSQATRAAPPPQLIREAVASGFAERLASRRAEASVSEATPSAPRSTRSRI